MKRCRLNDVNQNLCFFLWICLLGRTPKERGGNVRFQSPIFLSFFSPPPLFFSGRVAVTQASVVCTVNAKKANEHVQQRTLLGLITCITLCYLCLIERKISLLLWNAIIITIQSCFYLRFEDFWKLCFNNRCSYYFIFQTSFRPLKCFY